jgi:hypothetical protein
LPPHRTRETNELRKFDNALSSIIHFKHSASKSHLGCNISGSSWRQRGFRAGLRQVAGATSFNACSTQFQPRWIMDGRRVGASVAQWLGEAVWVEFPVVFALLPAARHLKPLD